jgi:gas vesicle protein
MSAFQTKETVEVTKSASMSLIEYGVLGILVILLGVSVFLLIRALIQAKNDHIKDKADMMKVLSDQTISSKDLTHEVSQMAEAVKTSVGSNRDDIERLGGAIGKLEGKIEQLVTKQIEFVAAAQAVRK